MWPVINFFNLLPNCRLFSCKPKGKFNRCLFLVVFLAPLQFYWWNKSLYNSFCFSPETSCSAWLGTLLCKSNVLTHAITFKASDRITTRCMLFKWECAKLWLLCNNLHRCFRNNYSELWFPCWVPCQVTIKNNGCINLASYKFFNYILFV